MRSAFWNIVAAGLRAGGLWSNKSTSSARQGRRAYRFFATRPLEIVKTFENHYKMNSGGFSGFRQSPTEKCIRYCIWFWSRERGHKLCAATRWPNPGYFHTQISLYEAHLPMVVRVFGIFL